MEAERFLADWSRCLCRCACAGVLDRVPPGSTVRSNHRTLWRLLTVEIGALEVQIPGRSGLVNEGERCLVPPMTQHVLSVRSGRRPRIFDLQFMILPFAGAHDPFRDFPHPVAIPTSEREMSCQRRAAMLDLVYQWRPRDAEAAIRLRPLVEAELAAFALDMLRSQPSQERPVADWLITLRRDVFSRCGDPTLSLSGIAASAGLSPNHLNRLWKDAFGTTCWASLVKARLDRAMEQIISGQAWTVAKVARESGFLSVSNFNAAFRTRFGKPPSAFR